MNSKGYGWDALSGSAHTLASWKASGSDNWNKAYRDELNRLGFDLIAVSRETQLGLYGPQWAPMPVEGPDAYHYPSVIAPIGWTLDDL